MPGWIIAAIPSDEDPVWGISSEKKPHMTVLFLGSQDSGETLSAVANSVSNVASQLLPPFWLDVKERTTLGPQKADVLMLHDRDLDLIKAARAQLLNDPVVRLAYDTSEQYPSWTPHLTLGYPDTPAHPDNRRHPVISSVHFDRLALWSLDSDGQVYTLNQSLREEKNMPTPLDEFLAQNGLCDEDALAHFGIKGMRWGIRRTDAEIASAPSAKPDAGEASLAKMKPGSTVTKVNEDGSTKVMIKKKDGSWDETNLSADAERFIKTRMKPGHELSDAELRTALNRANMVKQYDEMFGPKPSSELQAQVAQLQLQKQYSQLKKEMTPQRKSAVTRLVAVSGSAFGAYSVLDKATGGKVSAKIADNLIKKLDPATASRQASAEAYRANMERRKLEASVTKAEADAKQARKKARKA